MPTVSVLTSIYNGENYLTAFWDSFQAQILTDWEWIVVDDGSTDGTAIFLAAISKQDSRVKIMTNQRNLGLTKSLNIGLKLCQGKYVARWDVDDICAPGRLQRQLVFMEMHPNVVLCGSQGWYLNESGEKIGEKNLPTDYPQIKKKLLFNNQFIHSSWFFRRALVQAAGGYNESFKTSQDYELALRLAAKYQLANLPERLVSWRVGKSSLSWSSKKQEWDAIRARWFAIMHHGYPLGQGFFNIILRLGWLVLPQRLKIKRYF